LDDFRGANESKVQWIEEEEQISAFELVKTYLLNGLGIEAPFK
jgi:hypothetical protein